VPEVPGGRNDDFVDTLAHIGLGLNKLLKAPAAGRKKARPKHRHLRLDQAESERQRRKKSAQINLAGCNR
jgi:hypothetical protein